MTTTDIPTCGFPQPLVGPCREPRDPVSTHGRCTKHEQVQYRVCAGCAGAAVAECQGSCGFALCASCIHRADGTHGPIVGDEPIGEDFKAQRPAPEPALQVRQAMIEALDMALADVIERGMAKLANPSEEFRRRVAGVLLDGLAADVLMKTLQGMNVGQVQP